MSRDFYEYEAKPMQNNYTYQCMMGDTTREVVQIDAVEQTLAVIVNETGIAADCLNIMGGLTADQLRWIYSSLKLKQLKKIDGNRMPFREMTGIEKPIYGVSLVLTVKTPAQPLRSKLPDTEDPPMHTSTSRTRFSRNV